MDFKDYINQLTQLNNEDAKVELENFCAFNSGLLQFFAAIDKQVKAVLNSASISSDSVKTIQTQFEAVKPTLSKLKLEISMFDTSKVSEAYKDKINKTIAYIKEIMEIGEVDAISQQFFELLDKNETAAVSEKEQEIKRKEEAERKEIELMRKIAELVVLSKYDLAIACYDQAIKLNPNNDEYWYYKGLLFDLKEKYEEAIFCIDQAMKLNPTNSKYYCEEKNRLIKMKASSNS